MSKLKKDDHDTVRRALAMYERTTGEHAAGLINQIEVDDGSDPASQQKAAEEAYAKQAELNAKLEEAHQAERRARANRDAGTLQPGNPGPGQEALVTERAKAQGFSPEGREPIQATPGR